MPTMDYHNRSTHPRSEDSPPRERYYDYPPLPAHHQELRPDPVYRNDPDGHSPRYSHEAHPRRSPPFRPEYDDREHRQRYDPGPSSSSSSYKRPAPPDPPSSSSAQRALPKPRTEPESSSSKPAAKKETASAGPSGDPTTRRAAQACLRCRKQKLKCIGGWPCHRCTKSKNVCDFGRPPGSVYSLQARDSGASGGSGPSSEANARLEQLESSVANLLAGLAGGGQSYPNNEMLHTFDPALRRQESMSSEARAPYPPQNTRPWNPDIPPPTHIRPVDPPRVGSAAVPISAPVASMSPDDPQHHVRFTSSPNHVYFAPSHQSPSVISSNGTGPSPASAGLARGDSGSGLVRRDSSGPPGAEKEKKKAGGKRQKAEERLATATEGDFDEAPFKALVYQPAVWDNREQSRRSSPQPSQPQSRDEPAPGTYDRRFMRDKDDPINTDLVDVEMAENLFVFFIDHCHPFLPVVNVALEDAFNTIRQSPFLISAIIAVAARFYIRYTARSPGNSPPLDPAIPQRLANLAEAHLANTLLRKQHALSDVQAVMLLAAWGLQSGGRGPDAWVVTGHAARIARRLGVHKVLGQAAEAARISRPGTEGWSRLEAFMPQWRTWLCWFCFDGFLSLGFGRPQSTQFETVDEQGFLQIRLNQTPPRPGTTPSMSLYGDVYIAGQVQLTQIGRDLVNWGEMLADPHGAQWADPRRADMFNDKELNVRDMFKELNGRLDEWCKLWVWTVGSPYTLYLGSSARVARLQADHMRLCLNSFALKSGPDGDDLVAECLKKALNAAMSTIQTHHESSQTDLALSFATDYLTITLAQAAVFLVRIAKASPTVRSMSAIEPSVIAHYLKLAIGLLEAGELSETRLSTYLAKTIRDIARAAEIGGMGPPGPSESAPGSVHEGEGERSRPSSAHGNAAGPSASGTTTNPQPGANGSTPLPTSGLTDPAAANTDPLAFDMDSFLQFESQLDLGYLLGLPGDSPGVPPSGTAGGAGGAQGMLDALDAAGFNSEFSFGMGGMGGLGMGMGGYAPPGGQGSGWGAGVGMGGNQMPGGGMNGMGM
ncbi:hypothetical protein IAT38_000522 [Cryptococcus sp. DSM 104549]